MVKLSKSKLEKQYPEADIEYMLMLLENEVYMAQYEKKKLSDIDKMFTGDYGYLEQLGSILSKHFGKVERFDTTHLKKKVAFINSWDKLRAKMHKELIIYGQEVIRATYNYNRQYFLWVLDERIPELDIYEKPNIKEYQGEMFVGESKESKKLYDIGFTKEKLEELINKPRYKKTMSERIAQAIAQTDIALKAVFNDALEPLSDKKGRTYISTLKGMEKALNNNIRKLSKRAIEMEIQGVSEEAEADVMETNKHLLPNKWQRVEVLDGRTCLICSSVDGQVSNKRMGRIHPNCRGKDVPVKVEDGDIVYRQGLKGKRRRKDSFEQWFKKLSKKDKERVLGKTKYQLWQAGEFDLKELVKGNRVATLDELSKTKAIKELKEQLTDLDNARNLIQGLKEKLPTQSVNKMTHTEELNEYEKFLNTKLEVYKAIPNEVLRDGGTDRRTLIAEVKRERSVLKLKRKELQLKKAVVDYSDAKNEYDNN